MRARILEITPNIDDAIAREITSQTARLRAMLAAAPPNDRAALQATMDAVSNTAKELRAMLAHAKRRARRERVYLPSGMMLDADRLIGEAAAVRGKLQLHMGVLGREEQTQRQRNEHEGYIAQLKGENAVLRERIAQLELAQRKAPR